MAPAAAQPARRYLADRRDTCHGCREREDGPLTHWHFDRSGKRRRYHRGGCCNDPQCDRIRTL